jgi:hypothetical protein
MEKRGEPDLVGHDEKRANILMIVLRQVLQEGKCFTTMKRRIEKKFKQTIYLIWLLTWEPKS